MILTVEEGKNWARLLVCISRWKEFLAIELVKSYVRENVSVVFKTFQKCENI